MTATMLLLLIASAMAILAWVARTAFRNPAPVPPRAKPRRIPADRPPPRKPQALAKAPPSSEPELILLEWDSVPAIELKAAPVALDPLRQKIRDRYIAARFPGVARSSADLEEIERIIKAARLYFDEQKFDRADELLDLAVGQSPMEKSLRLAQLEFTFLQRDRARYTALAHDFRRVHPDCREWAEIVRLGHALAPQEDLFNAARISQTKDHYGPWPDMPNWLQASWDLTPEILAADFHRKMTRAPAAPVSPSQRNAA